MTDITDAEAAALMEEEAATAAATKITEADARAIVAALAARAAGNSGTKSSMLVTMKSGIAVPVCVVSQTVQNTQYGGHLTTCRFGNMTGATSTDCVVCVEQPQTDFCDSLPKDSVVFITLGKAPLKAILKTFPQANIGDFRSRIDGEVISHVALCTESVRSVFDSTKDNLVDPNTFAYVIGLTAKTTQSKTSDEKKSSNLIPTYNEKFKSSQPPQPPSTAANTSPDPNIRYSWYRPTQYAKLPWLTTEVIEAYFNRDSALMTDYVRRCLELEHPELAFNTGTLAPDHTWRVNFTASRYIALSEHKYVGQGGDQFLELIKNNPHGNDQMYHDLVALRASLLTKTAAERLKRPSFAELRYELTKFPDAAEQNQKKIAGTHVPHSTCVLNWLFKTDPEDLSCTPTSTRVQSVRLPFRAQYTIWPVNKTYLAAQNADQEYTITFPGAVYDTAIAAATGFVLPPPDPKQPTVAEKREKLISQWPEFIIDIINSNVLLSITAKINWDESMATADYYRLDTTTITHPVYVQRFTVDMREYLHKRALPVTANCAATLLGYPAAPSIGDVAAANQFNIMPWINLSAPGNENLLAAAIAARCEFRVVCSHTFGTRLSSITPELGDCIFDPRWKDDAHVFKNIPVIGPNGKTTNQDIDSEHKFRPLFVRDSFFFVYAIRPKSKCDTSSLSYAESVFKNGGTYNSDGIPIVRPVAAAAALPVVTTSPPDTLAITMPALKRKHSLVIDDEVLDKATVLLANSGILEVAQKLAAEDASVRGEQCQ